ncbi:MAG: Spore maturation protein B [candidate division BRC1 bacterium ADurb.Bin183]|nr:MAG: Spore maturation protein B [candidate division BRC1 bacterium ADurb.Bin183]
MKRFQSWGLIYFLMAMMISMMVTTIILAQTTAPSAPAAASAAQETSAAAEPAESKPLTAGRIIISLIDVFSQWCIPLIVIGIAGYAYFIKRVKVYEVFVEGAKEGFNVAIRIIPYLVAILFVIGIFRGGGAEGLINRLVAPVMNYFGVPSSILPLCLIRPLSGGGARAVMIDIFKTYGPDSMDGLITSCIQGSTETTFYVLAVYLGAVGVRRTRYAVAACLSGDIAGMIASVIICKIWPWPF